MTMSRRNRKQSRWRSVCRTCLRLVSRFSRAKGQSSYAAAAEKGIPAVLAEAGGVGQMQAEAVELLANGVVNVMQHLGMVAGAKSQIPGSKSQPNSKSKTRKTAQSAVATTKTSAADTAASA